MDIKIAKYSGFCKGVESALEKLDYAIAKNKATKSNKIIATMGPIIHNPQVVKKYQDMGVVTVNFEHEIKENSTLLIRAHGIPKYLEDRLKMRNIEIIDATCSKVKYAQLSIEIATKQIKNFQEDNSLLILYGDPKHPEVKGLISYSHIPCLIVTSADDLYFQSHQIPHNFVLAAQTTQNFNEFKRIQNHLQSMHPKQFMVLDTICDATQKRQDSVLELANSVDVFIVIGGKNSSNTKRLSEIAHSKNCSIFYIENTDELEISMLNKSLKYGITAGASTPKSHVYEVHKLLQNAI